MLSLLITNLWIKIFSRHRRASHSGRHLPPVRAPSPRSLFRQSTYTHCTHWHVLVYCSFSQRICVHLSIFNSRTRAHINKNIRKIKNKIKSKIRREFINSNKQTKWCTLIIIVIVVIHSIAQIYVCIPCRRRRRRRRRRRPITHHTMLRRWHTGYINKYVAVFCDGSRGSRGCCCCCCYDSHCVMVVFVSFSWPPFPIDERCDAYRCSRIIIIFFFFCRLFYFYFILHTNTLSHMCRLLRAVSLLLFSSRRGRSCCWLRCPTWNDR